MQRWRARKRIKGRGKNRRGLSKAGAADRECNVEHMQAAADSTGGKTGEAPGAWQQREKERRRKKKRQLGRRIELGSAELNAQIGRF